MKNLKDYLTHVEAAQVLGVSTQYALGKARDFGVETFKIANKWLYNRADLIEYALTMRSESIVKTAVEALPPAIDLDLELYITNTEARKLWNSGASPEALYYNTVLRSGNRVNPKTPQIHTVTLNLTGYNLFNRTDVIKTNARIAASKQSQREAQLAKEIIALG